MFLRREFFDLRKAAARIVAFLEISRKCWGEFVLMREMCLSDFSEQDRRLLDAGALQLLPGRDRSGRRVFAHFMNDVVDPTQPNELYMENRVRIGLYFGLKMVKYDVDAQRSGVVMICWMHDLRINDLKARSYVHKQLKQAIPFRINVVHCHVPLSGSDQQFANTGKAMFLLAISSRLRKRVRIHIGSVTEFLYYIQTFGIQSSQIPFDTRTEQRRIAHHQKWIKQQDIREKAIKLKKEFTGIECPRHSDVLYGRGWPIRKHAGNVLYRHLMKQSVDEYNNTTDRGSKTVVAWWVVTELQKSHGSRFLREDKRSGFWYEVSNIVASNKVSVGFRDMRKPKIKMDIKNSKSNCAQQTDLVVTTSSKPKCKEDALTMGTKSSLVTVLLGLEATGNGYGSEISSNKIDSGDNINIKTFKFIDTAVGKRQQCCLSTGTMDFSSNKSVLSQAFGVDSPKLCAANLQTNTQTENRYSYNK
mmetsp:Transcript_9639/g.19346  ORF Transcript_9639/g.19346 Transcript_9639/m.19346 type:complete len:474 (-) Transcript_9639:60-1481(-)